MRITWKKTLEVAEFASYIGVLIALGVAGMEYFSNAQQARVQRSIDLLTEFNAPELRPDRVAVEKPWLDQDLSALGALENNAGALDHLAKIIIADNPGTEYSLIYIIDLLDVIGRCVSAEICDETTINQQLGSYVDSLSCLYGGEIERLRVTKLLPRLGEAMSVISGGSRCER
jgi:hypothetical protein